MTPERWQQVRELLANAMQLDPKWRPEYLDQCCAADIGLRTQVMDLLVAEEEMRTDFLESLLQGEAVLGRLTAFTERDYEFQIKNESLIGRRVGSYQIVEEIGSGGMGEVYRAFRADDQYRLRVAVKVVRHDRNSEAVIERFRNERQILADLDHPNIARLLDGGTTEAGDPFFVMELIEGLPIDEYCNRRALTITERLGLFCQVCSAVEYAHRHLIVHRDIKPGNILVTSDGVAKLLDFGIAKILDAPSVGGQAQAKTALLRPLTPGYASPEQVIGSTITTASDVYSLGVVLYELLTGRSPYRLTSRMPQEIARAVCEIEPEKLSLVVTRNHPIQDEVGPVADGSAATAAARQSSPEKLSRRLNGDLDNIASMALRKEPRRRYVSVQQFADDIQRHLTSLPVIARKDTLKYRAMKFVYRNKAGVFAAGVLGTTILTALVLLIQANRIARQQSEMARDARARAERRFNDLRKLANSMIFDLPRPIHALPGSVAVEKMLFDSGLKYLDSLAAEAGDDVSLQRELAAGYKQLGDAMGGPYGNANLGDSAGAITYYRKALHIREIIAKSNPTNIQDQIDLAKTHRTLGYTLERAGDLNGSRDEVLKSLSVSRPLAETHGDNIYALNELSVGYLTLGFVDHEVSGELGAGSIAALGDFLESYKLVQAIARQKPDFVAGQEVTMLGVISQEYLEAGKSSEAVDYAQRELASLKRFMRASPSNQPKVSFMTAGAHDMAADALLFSGRYTEAASEAKEVVSESKILFDPKDSNSRYSLAEGYAHEGHAQENAGDAAAGLREIQKGIKLQLPDDKTLATDFIVASSLATSYLYEGEALEHLENLSEALNAYERTLDLSHSPALAVFPRTKLLAAASLTSIARVLAKLGNPAEALTKYTEALSLVEAAAKSNPPSPAAQYILTDVYAGMGNLSLSKAKSNEHGIDHGSEACRWFQKSADMWGQLPVHYPLAPNGFKVVEYSTVPVQLISCKN